MSKITVKKVEGENVFESLREEWQKLFAESESSPFLSFEWLSSWYKWFGANRNLFVLTAYRDNRLIGLLPLCTQEKKTLGMTVTRLGFIGEEVGGADYLDCIARTEDKIEIIPVFFDFLKNETSFDLISLENLSGDSEISKYLQKTNKTKTKNTFRYKNLKTSVCPKIDLNDGWESVLKKSKRASNFKRRLKQLEKMPGFEFRSVTSPDEINEAFERFFALHEKRWKKDGGSELSGHPKLISFQRDLVFEMSQTGLLRFDEVWVEGECRSSVYALDDGKTFYYYNSGYDLEWGQMSVGLVLIGLSVKSAIERGNSTYDFLRGEETYKFDWANKQTDLVTVNLSRNTLPALVYEGLNQATINLKKLSKSILPENLSQPLKNWRREWKRNYQLSDLEAEKSQ